MERICAASTIWAMKAKRDASISVKIGVSTGVKIDATTRNAADAVGAAAGAVADAAAGAASGSFSNKYMGLLERQAHVEFGAILVLFSSDVLHFVEEHCPFRKVPQQPPSLLNKTPATVGCPKKRPNLLQAYLLFLTASRGHLFLCAVSGFIRGSLYLRAE